MMSFLQIVGYDRDNLLFGRLRWMVLTPAERLDHEVQQFVPELKLTGSVPRSEKEYFRKSLEERGDQGVAFALDRTARKQAEAEVRESERRCREVQIALARGLDRPSPARPNQSK